MRRGVQLIAYADRLAGSLDGLRRLLTTELDGAFAGVHILPFFTPFDGADAGFDPDDHTRVDPRLGTWDDVRAIARTHDVTADLIVNHISSRSTAFTDWLERGEKSPHAGMFLTHGSVYPGGATEEELLRTYRPRPNLPFTVYKDARGRRHILWTTFTSEQIDLDVRHPAARRYLREVLETLRDGGVSLVRMDAVGFTVKTPGTSSFMTPETFAFIDATAAEAHALGLHVLSEVHSAWHQEVRLAERVDLIYDFALPPLILHAVLQGDGGPLWSWWERRPRNAVTVLDTHDGIGVADVAAEVESDGGDALLSRRQVEDLARRIDENSGHTSIRAYGATPADLYQVDCTAYDAVGRDDRALGLARALQFFTPGVPQMYYVGLLAGVNDVLLAGASGVIRDVNRHHYSAAELRSALAQPAAQTQLELARWRAHPVFDGDWERAGEPGAPELRFRADGAEARLSADLRTGGWEAVLRDAEGERRLGG